MSLKHYLIEQTAGVHSWARWDAGSSGLEVRALMWLTLPVCGSLWMDIFVLVLIRRAMNKKRTQGGWAAQSEHVIKDQTVVIGAINTNIQHSQCTYRIYTAKVLFQKPTAQLFKHEMTLMKHEG